VAALFEDRFFTTSEGLRIHYLDWGGDGPPLLFMHPTGFHAHVWDAYVAHFRDRFHCYAADLRGHGDSDKPGIYGWDRLASDIEELAVGLDLRELTGVGHSAGGTVIAMLAAHLPERVRRAVLLDPIFVYIDEQRVGISQSRFVGAARNRRMVWPDRQAILDRYGSRPPFNVWEPEQLALYVNYGVNDQPDGTVMLKTPGEDEAEVFRQAAHGFDPEAILRAVQCPTLLIAGDESDAFPRDRATRTLPLLAHGELQRFAGEGHFVPFTRSTEVMAAIDRFFAATDRLE
jgi:pimeloyl-ACP methyl ester carboxylesterase